MTFRKMLLYYGERLLADLPVLKMIIDLKMGENFILETK
jgi:hypothetical protein